MRHRTSPALFAGAAAFAVALVLFGSALLRAVVVPDVAPDDAAALPRSEPGITHADEQLSTTELVELLDNDPFQPDRTRPQQRYRLPGDVDPPPPPPPPPPPALPDFRVAGTAVTPQGGIAVMRIGDGPTRVLEVGEYMGGYWLERVSAETATMKNDEREVTVVVPGPASQVAAQPQPQPQQRQQTRGGQQQQRQMNAEQAALMSQMLEQARAQGATPQMLQAIQRMIQERGIENFRNMDVQIQGGGMTIRTRQQPDTSSTQPPSRQPR